MQTPPPDRRFRPDSSLAALASGRRSGRLLHTEHLPGRTASFGEWPDWANPLVVASLTGAGVSRPWSHQAAAAQAAHAGRHVVVSTGTASGKSLGYLLPILSDALDGLAAPSGRGSTALYLSPTKALAGDQLARIESLLLPGVRAATYDGDTPTEERRWVREHAHVVLTNPDLVHHSLLPMHERWAPFLRALRYVVVDECHVYRGVFGTHLSALLRRLRRVCARYGASPTFVLASATVASPADHAHRLTGLPVEAVDVDGSPRAPLTFALWEPPLVDADGRPVSGDDEPGAGRRSTLTETAELLAGLVRDGTQTVAFARSRKGVEVLAATARALTGIDEAPIAAYRGGYLPEERRALEQALRSRELTGLAATNALELGVDITGLDAVLLAGWPGTFASMWQQAGRAGRAGTEALAVLVADDDPLDSYLVHHPRALFDRPTDATVLDPDNAHVLAPHLLAAAAELPLTSDDAAVFGPTFTPLVESLTRRGALRRRPDGRWYWARARRPHEDIAIRGTAGPVVRVVERRSGRVLGTVDAAAAQRQVHAGAVHLHQGETYVVTELDLDDACALVVKGDPGWTTTARSVSSFDLLGEDRHLLLPTGHGDVRLSFGTVAVRSQVTSFLRRLPTGEVLGEHPLDLPESTLRTKGVWYTLAPDLLDALGVQEQAWPGALHAAEHAAIGMLPLLATADRWDIGGVSTALHPDTGLPTVLVYDGHPGGAGFAQRGYEEAGRWLGATLDAVRACPCERGCPSCVQSPKCGNGNEPLDKDGATRLLAGVVAAWAQHDASLGEQHAEPLAQQAEQAGQGSCGSAGSPDGAGPLA